MRSPYAVSNMTEQTALGSWRLVSKGKKSSANLASRHCERLLNHVYHHRGQLSVYLRLLDVPVLVVYGPTADENPFA
jgi:uncharacterized damage-inducible protein DinB